MDGLGTLVRPLLVTAILPAAAAGLGVVLAQASRRRLRDSGPLIGLCLAAGTIAAFVLIAGRPAFPPRDVVHWLSFALAGGWLVGLVDGLRTWPSLVKLALHGLLFAATVAALLQPLAARWETQRTGAWLVALTGAALFVWWLLEGPARKSALPFTLVPLLLSAGAFAGVMALSGSAKSSQLAGALAAGLGALSLGAFFKKVPCFSGAPLAVAVAGLTGVMAHAQLYTEVHAASTALAATAAASGALGRVPLIRLLPNRKLLLLAFIGAALPATAALLLAWSRFEPNPHGGY